MRVCTGMVVRLRFVRACLVSPAHPEVDSVKGCMSVRGWRWQVRVCTRMCEHVCVYLLKQAYNRAPLLTCAPSVRWLVQRGWRPSAALRAMR